MTSIHRDDRRPVDPAATVGPLVASLASARTLGVEAVGAPAHRLALAAHLGLVVPPTAILTVAAARQLAQVGVAGPYQIPPDRSPDAATTLAEAVAYAWHTAAHGGLGHVRIRASAVDETEAITGGASRLLRDWPSFLDGLTRAAGALGSPAAGDRALVVQAQVTPVLAGTLRPLAGGVELRLANGRSWLLSRRGHVLPRQAPLDDRLGPALAALARRVQHLPEVPTPDDRRSVRPPIVAWVLDRHDVAWTTTVS